MIGNVPRGKKRSTKRQQSNAESTSSDEFDFEKRWPTNKEKKQYRDYESASSYKLYSERMQSKRKQDDHKGKQNNSESASSDQFDSKGRYRKRIRSSERWDPPSDSDDRRGRAEKGKKRHSSEKHYYRQMKTKQHKKVFLPKCI